MVINVSQISEETGLKIEHDYPEGEPRLRGEESRIAGGSSLQATVTRKRDVVRLTGRVKAAVSIECDRCLSAFLRPVDVSFDLLYIPPTDADVLREERELAEDDLEVAFYRGDSLDVDDVVREQIELALPMTRLCSEECRGLCPECGANLNEKQCDCRPEVTDPRWAALKNLKS